MEELLKWFKASGGKIHPNLGVVKGHKGHFQFVVEKPIPEGEQLLELSEELVLSLDNSDFAEIDFTQIHDEILSDMTPYRIQTLLGLFELLKPNCSIQYEPVPIVRKKKKKKRQKKAVVEKTGPVTGKYNNFKKPFRNNFNFILGTESKWMPYLKYISERQNLNIPAYWSENDRKLLDGTSLEDRISDLDQEMQEELEKLIAPFFGESALKLSDPKLLTFDLFKVFIVQLFHLNSNSF